MTRATAFCNCTYAFGNRHCGSGCTRSDQEPSKETDPADQSDKEGGNARKDGSHDEARNKVIPFWCFECFLPFTHAFPAAIPCWSAHRAGCTNRTIAVIAAQCRFSVWMNITVQNFCHRYNPNSFTTKNTKSTKKIQGKAIRSTLAPFVPLVLNSFYRGNPKEFSFMWAVRLR